MSAHLSSRASVRAASGNVARNRRGEKNFSLHTEEKAPQAEHVYPYCTATGKAGLGRALPLAD